jgi:hypothetical protein
MSIYDNPLRRRTVTDLSIRTHSPGRRNIVDREEIRRDVRDRFVPVQNRDEFFERYDEGKTPFHMPTFEAPPVLNPIRMKTNLQEDAIREMAKARVEAARRGVRSASDFSDAASRRMLSRALGPGILQAVTGANINTGFREANELYMQGLNQYLERKSLAEQQEILSNPEAQMMIAQLQEGADFQNQQADQSALLQNYQLGTEATARDSNTLNALSGAVTNAENTAWQQGFSEAQLTEQMRMRQMEMEARREAAQARSRQQRNHIYGTVPVAYNQLSNLRDNYRAGLRLIEQYRTAPMAGARNVDPNQPTRRDILNQFENMLGVGASGMLSEAFGESELAKHLNDFYNRETAKYRDVLLRALEFVSPEEIEMTLGVDINAAMDTRNISTALPPIDPNRMRSPVGTGEQAPPVAQPTAPPNPAAPPAAPAAPAGTGAGSTESMEDIQRRIRERLNNPPGQTSDGTSSNNSGTQTPRVYSPTHTNKDAQVASYMATVRQSMERLESETRGSLKDRAADTVIRNLGLAISNGLPKSEAATILNNVLNHTGAISARRVATFARQQGIDLG